MSLQGLRAVLIAGALLAAAAARADFQAALRDYNAGHYDTAHSEFLALAELGDCSSQFNLAAMALKGQGMPQDNASGVGWLEAAAGNGCQQLVGNKLAALSAKLDAQQARTAAQIVGRYGRDALRAAFDQANSVAKTIRRAAPRLTLGVTSQRVVILSAAKDLIHAPAP